MTDEDYAVYAMLDKKPIHRQSIITTYNSAMLTKGLFWKSGKDYYKSLGYTLAVCKVNEYGEPVLYGDSYEIESEVKE